MRWSPTKSVAGLSRDFWALITCLLISDVIFTGVLDFISIYLFEIAGLDFELIGAAFTISKGISFPLSLFSGYFCDFFGRKKTLLISPFLGFVGMISLLYALNFYFLLFSLFLLSISNLLGIVSSQSYIGNVVEKTKLERAYGIYSSLFGIGWSLGPIIAGFIITSAGYHVAIIASGIFMLISMFFRLSFLKEEERRRKKEEKTCVSFKMYLDVKTMRSPTFFFIVILQSLWSFAEALLSIYLSLYLKLSLNFKEDVIGFILSSIAITDALMSPFTGWLSEKWNRKYLLSLSVFSDIPALIAFITLREAWLLFSVGLLWGALSSFYWPIMDATIAKNVKENDLGKAFGFLSFVRRVAGISGPMIGGILFDTGIMYPFYFRIFLSLSSVLLISCSREIFEERKTEGSYIISQASSPSSSSISISYTSKFSDLKFSNLFTNLECKQLVYKIFYYRMGYCQVLSSVLYHAVNVSRNAFTLWIVELFGKLL